MILAIVCAALVVLVAGPAVGQGLSEANGSVKDREGNPIAGAVVSFRAQSKPETAYTGKTNKKGTYSISGLWTGKEDELWNMSIEVEGHLPVSVRVESRNAQRILIGDIITQDLSAKQGIPEITIRPLGKATVDWTVAPREAVEEERRAANAAETAAAIAADSGTSVPTPRAAPAATQDPWNEALTLVQAGDLAGSIQHFSKAIADQPQNAERHEAFAKVLYQTKDLDRALSEAQRAVEIDPTRVDSWLLQVRVADGRGDAVAAKATLDRAIAADPRSVRLHQQAAHLADKAGQPGEEIRAYQKVVEIDPKNTEAWVALGGLHAEQGDAAKSEQAYQQVVALDPKNAYQTYYNIGALIMNREARSDKDKRNAIEAFRKAIEIKPDYGPAHQQLAYALLGVGDKAGALETLKAYLRVSPDAPDAGPVKAMIQTLEKK